MIVNDNLGEMLVVAKTANQIDWEYKPTIWAEPGEPPISYHKVVSQLPEIQFPNGNITFPSVEYVLTMPNIDISDALHITTFNPKTMQRILNRLSKAEDTVERLDSLCVELEEGEGGTTNGAEPEYPLSYFREVLRTALDETA